MALVGDSLLLYIISVDWNISLLPATSQACQGVLVCPVVWLLDAVGDRDSWLLSIKSPPLSFDSLASKFFSHNGNLSPVW